MSEIFKILRIDEADYGCEGVPDGEPVKAEVTIETQSGSQYIMKISDALLYEQNLNEGDSFSIDNNGNMLKI